MTAGPEIAAALREIAGYMALEGERFRARAYERAARNLEGVADVERLLAARRLTEVPGIGRALEGLIGEIACTGRAGLLDRLRERWPRDLAELALLPRIGPDRARRIFDALQPRSLDEVAMLCERGRVRVLPGFSRVSEARVLDAIRRRFDEPRQITLEAALELSEVLARQLRRFDGARVEVCGPVRRSMEVADRIALAVATRAPDALEAHVRTLGAVSAVEAGPTPGSLIVRLTGGMPCELHVRGPGEFGAALVFATGSAAHLEKLSRHAAGRGIALESVGGATEAAVHASLGLTPIPPELRDGTDEIAAALAGDDFHDLVELGDLQGAVHCHTTYSDGKDTIAAMAAAAAERGLSYVTVTDHSQSASYAGGLAIDDLRRQWAEIAEVQRTTPVRILRGTECDILPDGALDYPYATLAEMQIVIASIHKRHKLDEDGMTRRLVAAIRHPLFKVWGHALGRILLHRDPIPCRFADILDAIEDAPVAIELNGDPRRLDLEPGLARRARERGATFVLSCDAHSVRSLDNLAFAVGIARRARIRRSDVLNALPADEFCERVRPRQ